MTPPMPTRDTPAGRAYNELRNLARRDGRDPAEYFTLYALEGFLARLAASEQSDAFVLKGGVLLAAFAARRPTRDIDFAAAGLSNDVADVERRVRAIVIQPLGDGLVFDPGTVTGEPIREDAAYPGVRVKVAARLASAQIALHADVNFGDPIWPAPTAAELPLLLGGTLRLLAYPDHMVLAEKLVTAVDRGEQNTRWRDFVDIVAITDTRRIDGTDLRAAVETVAQYRGISLRPLASLLAQMPELAQGKWALWRRKQRLDDTTPDRFGELLAACIAFADPALDGDSNGKVWEPSRGSWIDSTE